MIGIAIINYITFEKTIECIESIRKKTNVEYKIYLLDNKSPNESVKVLRETYHNASDICFIESDENLGYARGNNLCIKYMENDGCKYGVISNNDILLINSAIDNLLDIFKSNKNVIIAGPKILDVNNNFQNSIKLNKDSFNEYIFQHTYLSNFFRKKLRKIYIENSKINKRINVYWISGSFFMFDLEKLSNIERFDPNTFLFYEEYILSEKILKTNYEIIYEPMALVLHYHAISTGGGVNINTKIENFKSEIYFLTKYKQYNLLKIVLIFIIRNAEAIYTFGKAREIDKIRKFMVNSMMIIGSKE